MEQIFNIITGKVKSEFSVISIPDAGHGVNKFQGLINGVVFCQSKDYELIRRRVMRAVDLNSHDSDGSN